VPHTAVRRGRVHANDANASDSGRRSAMPRRDCVNAIGFKGMWRITSQAPGIARGSSYLAYVVEEG
jgi:hypothetical protein